jgi:tetracycline repressor-like protein
VVQMFRDYVASLPEDRFPQTRGAIDLLFGGDVDDRFEFGLELMIRGIETYISRPSDPA